MLKITKHNQKFWFLASGFWLLAILVNAQYDVTLFYMNKVPQSNYINPATLPRFKVYIGIPYLSSLNLKAGSSAFPVRDLFTKTDDGDVYFTFDTILPQLSDFNNFFYAKFDYDIFGAGYKYKKYYVNFNITEKFAVNFAYPKDMITFLNEGNGAFIGETAMFNGIGGDIFYYREYGLGTTIPVKENFVAGGKIKLLCGKFNIHTYKSNFSFYTSPDNYAIDARANFLINTSGLPLTTTDTAGYIQMDIDTTLWDPSKMAFSFFTTNKGISLDLGFYYELNYKWSFYSSFIDIGSIKWKSQIKNFYTEDASFEFEGLDLGDFFDESDTTDQFEALIDSISKTFQIKENTEPYKTWLTPKIYLGTTYRITYKMKTGILLHGEFFGGTLYPSASVALHRRFGQHFALTGSYSVYPRDLVNVGLGINSISGPIQFYFVTDDIFNVIYSAINSFGLLKTALTKEPSPIYLSGSKHFSIHFGFNLLFGYQEKKMKEQSMIE